MKIRSGMLLPAVLATSVAASGGLALWAQAPAKNAPPSVPRTVKRVDPEVRLLRSSTIVGTTVALQGGVKFGEVQEFVFTPDGCIDYVIVMHERRFYPVPWVVTTFNPADRVILVDIDPVVIRQAPSFTQITQVTELNNVQFVEKVRTHFRVDAQIRPRPDRDGDRRDRDRRDPAGTKPADPKKPADAIPPAAPKKPAGAIDPAAPKKPTTPGDSTKPVPKSPAEPKLPIAPKPSVEPKPPVEPKKPLEPKPIPEPK